MNLHAEKLKLQMRRFWWHWQDSVLLSAEVLFWLIVAVAVIALMSVGAVWLEKWWGPFR